MSDFIINRILVRGSNVKDSELRFMRGVNLITGGSETGKTYVFELIDYAFGSKVVPSLIKERTGYNDVYLEFVANGIIYTLLRSFTDSDNIKVYIKDIDSIDEKTYFKDYKVDPRSESSISKFLMGEIGYDHKLNFRKNKTDKNALQQMTFRNYIKSFMISEEKITAKSISIIETELKYPKPTFTLEKLIFFLTNNGNKEKKKIKKKSNTKVANKLEMLEELLSEHGTSLKRVHNEYNNFKSIITKELDISCIQDQIKALEVKIDEAKKTKVDLFDKLKNNADEMKNTESTIVRFEVLAEQYKTEMDRLDFVYEGESYLCQIKQIICPLCDTIFEDDTLNLDDIFTAFDAEKNKLAVKLIDIEETIQDLNNSSQVLIDCKEVLEESLREIALDIDNNLLPKLNDLIFDYSNAVKKKELEAKIKVYEEEKIKLEDKIETLNGIIDSQEEQEEVIIDTTLFINRRTELCKEMERLLRKLKFNETVEVIYNEDEMDFIVNNQQRKAYGQGYSSIIYISFVLALKKIMDKYNVATPNFVIFDSPFTSLTEGDEIKEKRIQVSSKIVDAFFDYVCSEYKNKQLILFENSKEKYENINKCVNYVHFTKNRSFGRYGFFKVVE